jgi:gliding motility-associated-like protein
MKKKLLIFLLFPTLLRGQQLVSFAGGTLKSAGGATVSYSLGEIAIATLQSTNHIATQGVQQPLTKPAAPKPEDNIVIYNGLTTNGDKINDVFFIDSVKTKYPNNRLVILNIWGELLLDAAPYDNEWHGTDKNGTPLPLGTYYYLFYPDRNDRQRKPIRDQILILK